MGANFDAGEHVDT